MGESFLHLLERYVGRKRRQNALYPVSTLLINALPTKEAQAEQKRPHRRTPQDIYMSVRLTSNFWCSCKNIPPTRGLDVALLGKGVEHAQTLYYAQAHPARMRSPRLLTTVVRESVRDRKVNGSHSICAKVFFLCIVGLGRYSRQPTDRLATALAAD